MRATIETKVPAKPHSGPVYGDKNDIHLLGLHAGMHLYIIVYIDAGKMMQRSGI